MEVIPAIDLMGGECVQLVGGRPETRKSYGDPVAKALEWDRKGARMLHVVDLDATLGTGSNLDSVLRIKEATRLPMEFGGGIRSLHAALDVLGALQPEDRIIIGTMAVSEYPGFKTLKMLSSFRDRIIVSVDSRGDHVAVKGWTQSSQVRAAELMEAVGDLAWGFLYTNVDVEGLMEGVDCKRVNDVVKATKKPVIVSGGVSSPADVKACDKAGAWGAVLGKALYEGKIRLEDVI